MSNYASVILAFRPPDVYELGVAKRHEYIDDVRRSREFVEEAFANLGCDGWHVRDTTWAHGCPASDTMCCETVVRFCVNHFDPDEFWTAAFRCAPWLAADHMEAQAWAKDENDDAYTEIPR